MKNKNIIFALVVLLAVGTLCVATITMKTQDKEENDYINPYKIKIQAINVFEQIRQPCEEICTEMQSISLSDNDKITIYFENPSKFYRGNDDNHYKNAIYVYDGKIECENNTRSDFILLQKNEKLCNALIDLEKIGIIIYIEYFSKGFAFTCDHIPIKPAYQISFYYALDEKDVDKEFLLEKNWMYGYIVLPK